MEGWRKKGKAVCRLGAGRCRNVRCFPDAGSDVAGIPAVCLPLQSIHPALLNGSSAQEAGLNRVSVSPFHPHNRTAVVDNI